MVVRGCDTRCRNCRSCRSCRSRRKCATAVAIHFVLDSPGEEPSTTINNNNTNQHPQASHLRATPCKFPHTASRSHSLHPDATYSTPRTPLPSPLPSPRRPSPGLRNVPLVRLSRRRTPQALGPLRSLSRPLRLNPRSYCPVLPISPDLRRQTLLQARRLGCRRTLLHKTRFPSPLFHHYSIN